MTGRKEEHPRHFLHLRENAKHFPTLVPKLVGKLDKSLPSAWPTSANQVSNCILTSKIVFDVKRYMISIKRIKMAMFLIHIDEVMLLNFVHDRIVLGKWNWAKYLPSQNRIHSNLRANIPWINSGYSTLDITHQFFKQLTLLRYSALISMLGVESNINESCGNFFNDKSRIANFRSAVVVAKLLVNGILIDSQIILFSSRLYICDSVCAWCFRSLNTSSFVFFPGTLKS